MARGRAPREVGGILRKAGSLMLLVVAWTHLSGCAAFTMAAMLLEPLCNITRNITHGAPARSADSSGSGTEPDGRPAPASESGTNPVSVEGTRPGPQPSRSWTAVLDGIKSRIYLEDPLVTAKGLDVTFVNGSDHNIQGAEIEVYRLSAHARPYLLGRTVVFGPVRSGGRLRISVKAPRSRLRGSVRGISWTVTRISKWW